MNLIEKIVTINTVTNLNPADKKPINFKDENGDKYVLWKTKQDGSETMAYSFFKSLPYGGDGQSVGIAYEEVPMTFTNDQGKEIAFKQRSVKVMKAPSAVRPANQVPNTPMQKQSERLASERKEDWSDKAVFGKCKTLFLVEAFKASLGDSNIRLAELELRAEEWAKASMRVLGEAKPEVKDSHLTDQQFADLQGFVAGAKKTDEVNVSDIPF